MFEPSKVSSLKFGSSAHGTGATGGTKGRPRRLLMAAAGVAVAIVGIGAWLIWGRGEGDTAFLTQKVTVGNIEDTVTALGTIQPLQFVDVGTQVSGQLKVLHADYGQQVKKGDLLAEIDPQIYQSRVNADQAQLLNLRAQLSQRQAQKVLADIQFKRQQELIKENATSQDAYDTAESNLKVAIGQIASLEAQIKQTESTLSGDLANLSYTKIYAPMDGTVVNLIAKQGQTLNANQTAPLVLRISDLATMTVWAQVSEADVPKLKVGMKAYFTTLGMPDKRRYGKLRQIIPTPEIVNNVVLYDCLFDVPNPDGELLTQMSAQVYFIAAEARDALLAPVGALHQVRAPRPERNGSERKTERAEKTAAEKSNAEKPAAEQPPEQKSGERTPRERPAPKYTVRVLVDGEPQVRDVEVGVMNRLQAEIKSGLAEGDEVVLDAPSPSARPANQNQQRGPGGGMGGGGPRL